MSTSNPNIVHPGRQIKIIKRRSRQKFFSYICTLPRDFIHSLESAGVNIADARLEVEYDLNAKTVTFHVVDPTTTPPAPIDDPDHDPDIVQ